MKLVQFCLARCEDRRRTATRQSQVQDAVALAGQVTRWGRKGLLGDRDLRGRSVASLLDVARRDDDHPDFLPEWRDDEALHRWLND